MISDVVWPHRWPLKDILPSHPHWIHEQPQRQRVKSKSQISPFFLFDFDFFQRKQFQNFLEYSSFSLPNEVYFDADSWIVMYSRWCSERLVFQRTNSIVKKSNILQTHFFVVYLQQWIHFQHNFTKKVVWLVNFIFVSFVIILWYKNYFIELTRAYTTQECLRVWLHTSAQVDSLLPCTPPMMMNYCILGLFHGKPFEKTRIWTIFLFWNASSADIFLIHVNALVTRAILEHNITILRWKYYDNLTFFVMGLYWPTKECS